MAVKFTGMAVRPTATALSLTGMAVKFTEMAAAFVETAVTFAGMAAKFVEMAVSSAMLSRASALYTGHKHYVNPMFQAEFGNFV
jgi:hypothetical protein